MEEPSSSPAFSDATTDHSEKSPLLERKLDSIHHGKQVQVSVYQPGQPEIRTYWWRWVVLAIFCLNLGMSNFIWVLASPVADVFTCYYHVSDTVLNLLSMSYMITYIIFVFPFMWLLYRYGLRFVMILGTCMTVLGAALRLAATGANHYWLLLTGQAIASLCNALIWGAAPFLSEVWFPATERATATAFSGAIAPNAGVLLGLGLGPILIHHHLTDDVCSKNSSIVVSPSDRDDWSNTISNQLFYYLLGQAVLSLVILVLTFVAFPKAPPSPPSLSRYLEEINHSKIKGVEQAKEFLAAIITCLKNKYFLLFLVPSGLIIAVFSTVVSVFDTQIKPFFNDIDHKYIAYLGIVIEASAILSMLAIGFILDKTKQYYLTNLSVCFGAAAFLAVYASVIQFQHTFNLLYLPMILVGFTTCAYQALAYEYAVEMTYPVPEVMSAGIINVVSQIITIVFLVFVGHFSGTTPEQRHLVPYGTWFLVGVTSVAAIVALFIRPELRRVKIDKGEGANLNEAEHKVQQSSGHF